MSRNIAYPAPRRTVSYKVSQNFITSVRTIERMLDCTDIGPADAVWDIGAGKGHLTRRLAARARQVTAIEIDPDLAEYLRGKFSHDQRVKLIHGDFLTAGLPASGAYKVFANIPFHITSEIIHKLTTASNPPTDCWLVMEKGAAKRFAGLPKESVHSLMLKPYFDIRVVYHLRPDDFHPKPSVEAVMIHMRRKGVPDVAVAQRGLMAGFVREMWDGLYAGRRGPLTRHQVMTALRRDGLGEIPASAALDYAQWLCLFRFWARNVPRRK